MHGKCGIVIVKGHAAIDTGTGCLSQFHGAGARTADRFAGDGERAQSLVEHWLWLGFHESLWGSLYTWDGRHIVVIVVVVAELGKSRKLFTWQIDA